jgi:hypothetical protein
MATIRERIETSLREADPDSWFTQREIAELINAKVGSVRWPVRVMWIKEGLLEKKKIPGDVRNPATGEFASEVYRWRR